MGAPLTPQNITEPWPGGSVSLYAGDFPGVGHLTGWWSPGAHSAAARGLSLAGPEPLPRAP